MIHSVRCVTAPLTRKNCFSVTYVTPVGIWTASSPPSPPSLLGYRNVPCVPLLPPHPRVHCETSASPLPSLNLTLTKHHLGPKKNHPPSLLSTKYCSQQKIKKTAFSLAESPVTNSGPISTCTPMTRGRGLKTKFNMIPWFAMGGTWDLDPDGFSSTGFFSWTFFKKKCVLADRSPPSPIVAFISASRSCRVNYT